MNTTEFLTISSSIVPQREAIVFVFDVETRRVTAERYRVDASKVEVGVIAFDVEAGRKFTGTT